LERIAQKGHFGRKTTFKITAFFAALFLSAPETDGSKPACRNPELQVIGGESDHMGCKGIRGKRIEAACIGFYLPVIKIQRIPF
jgi:hypothetical protein